MRNKTFIAVLLAVVTLFAAVSCSEFEEYMNKCMEAELEGNEFYLLDFTESATRGMTKFPDSNPFLSGMNSGSVNWNNNSDGMEFACEVMSTLPIIPSLKKYTSNVSNVIALIKEKTVYGYGFPLKIASYKLNMDGVCLRYDILEDSKKIGMIDYYYSWKSQTFSYREIVIPYLSVATLAQYHQDFGNNILYFEMKDVPVYEDENGIHFTAGGSDKYYKFWQIGINSHSSFNNQTLISVGEFDMLMDHQGDDVTSIGYKEKYICHNQNFGNNVDPDCINPGIATFFKNPENISKYHYVIQSGDYGHSLNNVTLDNDYCNMEFTWELMEFFADEGTVDTLLSDVKTINNISDFNKRGLTFNNLMQEKAGRYSIHSGSAIFNPIMFNLETKSGAYAKYSSSGAFGYDFSFFKEYFSSIFSSATTNEEILRVFMGRFGLSEDEIDEYIDDLS